MKTQTILIACAISILAFHAGATRAAPLEPSLRAVCSNEHLTMKAFAGESEPGNGNGPVRFEIQAGQKREVFYFRYHDETVFERMDGTVVAVEKSLSEKDAFGRGILVRFIPFGKTLDSKGKIAVLAYDGNLEELDCQWKSR